MSRKSRQKGAQKKLSMAIPLTWLSILLLVGGLWIGILGFLSPLISQPVPLEDTIPISATMEKVEGDYTFRGKTRKTGWQLDNIFITFEDHERLHIGGVIASEALLEKLEAYPAGTVFDMHVKPGSTGILTLSVDGTDVLSYEAACRAITANNGFGVLLGFIMLPIAGYAAWSLAVRWTYRRLT